MMQLLIDCARLVISLHQVAGFADCLCLMSFAGTQESVA